jgi:MerR family transcriptional regulator, light-induced transcriptional regulator
LVYIRSKKVKGIHYAYLVGSRWDRERGSAIQHTIKYLGRADGIEIGDIPQEYRNDPRILSFISSYSSANHTKKESLLEKLRGELFDALCNSDRETATKIATKYSDLFSLTEFYMDLLTPVMYRVGDLWEQGRLSVATEHVCSNVANNLIQSINDTRRGKGGKSLILICSPEGEIHHLAADMLESILLQKGYEVYNVSPSAPAASIAGCIDERKPKLVMISVTLEDNLGAARRLIKEIRKSYQSPIILGGAATKKLKEDERIKMEKADRVSVFVEPSLKKVLQYVSTYLVSTRPGARYSLY